ncbi:MAG: glycosyltransferase family 4 protein [Thermodesulfobacteriota bacterium]
MEKKILFIETGNHGGGSFGSLSQTISTLDRKRFHPIVFYLNPTPHVERMRRLGVKVYLIRDLLYNNTTPEVLKRALVGLNWFLGSRIPRLLPLYEWLIHAYPLLRLRSIVRREGVDLIHLNNTMVRHFFCVVGLRGLGVPIVSHLRSFIIKGANPYMAKYTNQNVIKYIAYSEGVKDYWAAVGVDKGNVDIIPNGIGAVQVAPLDVWKHIDIPRRKGPLIGCVGAVKVNRTYDYMLRSFVHILKQEPEAFLLIVGKWMDRGLCEKLQRMARDLGIADSVRFHGPDSEATRIISGLDALSIPYRIEPFGRVLLEAWALGIPVIATRVGRIDQIISHMQDGILVNHGDEHAMTSAVLTLFRDRTLRSAMAERGRKTVQERFSIQSCTRQLESLYDGLLS